MSGPRAKRRTPRRSRAAGDDPGRRARGARSASSARGAARFGRAVATPFAPLALATTAPAGGSRARPCCSRAPRPKRTLGDLGAYIDALGARFDGRLRIFAVDRAHGKRVIFGAPDAPRATVAEAVLASCAVPWIFAPVEIGGREYVDGGVWSPTNLDAVPAGRGSRVLCLIPTAGAALSAAADRSAAAAGYERMALRARGAEVRTDRRRTRQPATAIGPDLMDAEPPRARSPRPATPRAGACSSINWIFGLGRPIDAGRSVTTLALRALLAAAALLLTPVRLRPAHAQATRTWVSGVGDDVNPCSRTAPCKTFAGAISQDRGRRWASTRSDPGGVRRGHDHEGDHDRRRRCIGGVLQRVRHRRADQRRRHRRGHAARAGLPRRRQPGRPRAGVRRAHGVRML